MTQYCWMIVCVLVTLCLLLSEVHSLQCYQCTGQTNYDPDLCFDVNPAKTIIVECSPGSECEKRIERIDKRNRIVNRGCTANCNNRKYIYTDDFQVHCCNTDQCNAASRISTTSTLSFISLCIAGYFTRRFL